MPRNLLLLYSTLIFLVSAGLVAVLTDAPPFTRAVGAGLGVTAVAAGILVVAVRGHQLNVRKVTDAARRISRGQYGHEIFGPVEGDVGVLTREFNAMSVRLAEEFARVEQDRQQLRAVLGGMIEGVVAIDAQQRLLFANDRGSRLLEFNLATAINLKFWEVVRQRPIVGLVEQALDTGEPRQQEFDWKGNPEKTLMIHVSPLRDKPGGAIIVIHDTSELRRLERLRHEFVANVSHELKSPLAVIKASAETLRDGAIDDLEHRGVFIDQIHDQAERLHALVLDLLSLARIETGRETIEYRRVVLSEAVRECFDRHQARADARHQVLEMLPPVERSSDELRTDEEALAQILDNLIDNAMKYTHEGSRIQVRWYGVGDQIRIEVADDGPGIPEEDVPRIFERFYRVDKARSREMGGTGLGLAIVKNLVQIMKGSVKVESRVGTGTTFTVCLPRAAQ